MDTKNSVPTDEERASAALVILRDAGWLDETDGTPEPERYDDCLFDAGNAEYLVLTDDEAEERAAEYIRESLWAFNTSFLISYVPEGITEDVLRMIGEKCEDGNPSMLALVGEQLDELTADAISSDGRGHFLAGYDSEEIEHEIGGRYWYGYRVN